MNEEITANLNYEWAKTEITKELQTEANSFIRVGWIFKMVRDGKIETPYGSVTEFAEKEWNLGKDVVSRYMRINDHFSINGYSEMIAPQYRSFGYSKLAIMLTLPDEINEELSPEYSKSDIQAIKDEYDAEQKITPLEVMAEPKADQPETEGDEFVALVVKQINDEHPDPIYEFHFNSRALAEVLGIPDAMDKAETAEADIRECYMPEGDSASYNIRINGQGRFMVSMKDSEIMITNIRTLEKTPVSWQEFTEAVLEDETRREFKKPADPERQKAKKEKVHQSVIQKKAKEAREKYYENPKREGKGLENNEKPAEVIEKVEGDVIDAAEIPKSTQLDASELAEQCMDNALQEAEEAAGEDAKSEALAAGDEDVMINKLEMLLSPTECYRIRELTKEIDSIHGYRENLDRICEWIAQLHTVTNNLYAKLASRGM